MWLHPEQRSDRVCAPDDQLVNNRDQNKGTDYNSQHLDRKTDLPPYDKKCDENDHRLVEKEERITRLTAVPER